MEHAPLRRMTSARLPDGRWWWRWQVEGQPAQEHEAASPSEGQAALRTAIARQTISTEVAP